MANSVYGFLLVFLGAGIGGVLRHAVNRSTLPFGAEFPWATLTINVTGSFLMGLIAGWFAFHVEGAQQLGGMTSGMRGQQLRLFLTTGILGGYTTFSAFSLESVLLWERGRIVPALGYIGGSVILSIAALFLGIALLKP